VVYILTYFSDVDIIVKRRKQKAEKNLKKSFITHDTLYLILKPLQVLWLKSNNAE